MIWISLLPGKIVVGQRVPFVLNPSSIDLPFEPSQVRIMPWSNVTRFVVCVLRIPPRTDTVESKV
jgi:hypothetical protein